jgi:serine/threonine-protein kinase
VCAVLNAAHRRVLVHRDLKPENIALVTTELSEIAKVLDFGAVKFLSNTRNNEQQTQRLAPFWTPCVTMSPERRGRQAAHQAWDLWALAVMTYEMLTGVAQNLVRNGRASKSIP